MAEAKQWWWFLGLLIAGCGSARPAVTASVGSLAPAVRAQAAVDAWVKDLRDPASIGGEDLHGQTAILYRAIGTASPATDLVIASNVTNLVFGSIACVLPITSYLTGYGCDPDPQLQVPTGPLGPALAALGLVDVTPDGTYGLVDAGTAARAVMGLAKARRTLLAARIGNGACTVDELAATLTPAPVADTCPDPRAAPPAAAGGGSCLPELLWNTWVDDVTAVWIVRATCEGAPATFAVTAGAPSGADDQVLFAAPGASPDTVLAAWRAVAGS